MARRKKSIRDINRQAANIRQRILSNADSLDAWDIEHGYRRGLASNDFYRAFNRYWKVDDIERRYSKNIYNYPKAREVEDYDGFTVIDRDAKYPVSVYQGKALANG